MAFTYRLEKEDGTSADPPVLHTPYRHGTSTVSMFRPQEIRQDRVLVVSSSGSQYRASSDAGLEPGT
jgi:hypothetical protein